jgi:hypothetical protein
VRIRIDLVKPDSYGEVISYGEAWRVAFVSFEVNGVVVVLVSPEKPKKRWWKKNETK